MMNVLLRLFFLHGSVDGNVVDSTGASLPGVTVEIRQRDALQQAVVTGRDGKFAVALRPGEYAITFRLAGFAPATRRVRVEGGASARADSALSVADEEMIVTAQLDRAASAGVVTAAELARRPMLRPADALESGPGIVVSQHSGAGKANQFAVNSRIRVQADCFNLLDAEASDVDYFYTSRLPGEPADGVNSVHFHPVERRSIRIGLTTTF